MCVSIYFDDVFQFICSTRTVTLIRTVDLGTPFPSLFCAFHQQFFAIFSNAFCCSPRLKDIFIILVIVIVHFVVLVVILCGVLLLPVLLLPDSASSYVVLSRCLLRLPFTNCELFGMFFKYISVSESRRTLLRRFLLFLVVSSFVHSSVLFMESLCLFGICVLLPSGSRVR